MWPSGDLMGQYSNCGDIFGLRALVTGPRVYAEPYKPFSGMSASRLVRTLTEGGAWDVAKEVLVYRRHHDAHGTITDLAGLQKDLDSPFKMQWGDARMLCDYGDLFDDCMRIAKQGTPKELPAALQAVLPPPTATLPSLALFFASWLLAYRFGYDTVRAFSRRNPLTLQQLADFHLHARLIAASRHFKRHVCWPRWSTALETLYPDLLLLWGHDLRNCDWLTRMEVMAGEGGSALLRHKVFFHLAAVGVEREDWECGQVIGWMGLRRSWERDRVDASVETLVSKYEKCCDLGGEEEVGVFSGVGSAG